MSYTADTQVILTKGFRVVTDAEHNTLLSNVDDEAGEDITEHGANSITEFWRTGLFYGESDDREQLKKDKKDKKLKKNKE